MFIITSEQKYLDDLTASKDSDGSFASKNVFRSAVANLANTFEDTTAWIEGKMKLDWHTLATIIITVIAVGGVMVALLRGFFMTPRKCSEMQDKCQGNICKKIDELKLDVKSNRDIVSAHYAEIKESLGEINGKLNG